jgi:hypothetical protein
MLMTPWSRVTEKTRGAIFVHFAGFISPELTSIRKADA